MLIKRYARSRLYDTARHCYVSIEQLHGWAASGTSFVVIDTETQADVTQVLLA
jgi:polyhydroxyalkanoate synthesis regulator protein